MSNDGNYSGEGKGKSRYLVPNSPPFSLGTRDGRDGPHYTPWLVVRYAAGDVGTRPLPGGTVFWESPDVWVDSSLGQDQPVPGEANTVRARVSNLGLEDANGVFVKFWWANPSLAITEATANLIGIGSANITAGSTAVVTCPNPWVPVIENGGHECLLAEAYLPVLDALTSPMDPVDDRHVGQKNEQLVIVGKGQHMIVNLQAANVSGFAQALSFEVQPLPPLQLSKLLSARARTHHFPLTPIANVLAASLEVGKGPGFFAGPSANFARRLLSATQQEIAGTAMDCSAPTQIVRTEPFEPWELRNVEVAARVPADAKPGQAFAFRVVQRIGRLVAGGYTVVAIVADPP
jgi:hypothetical protein